MSALPIQKRIVLAAFALATVLVPIVLGAVSGRSEAQSVGEDRSPVPIVRIAPEYPPEALAAGLPGEVTLEFTIAANGSVRDAFVVDSSAPEFEAPALAALLRWRYLPTDVECVGTVCTPIEGAAPVERSGLRTMIRFAPENARSSSRD